MPGPCSRTSVRIDRALCSLSAAATRQGAGGQVAGRQMGEVAPPCAAASRPPSPALRAVAARVDDRRRRARRSGSGSRPRSPLVLDGVVQDARDRLVLVAAVLEHERRHREQVRDVRDPRALAALIGMEQRRPADRLGEPRRQHRGGELLDVRPPDAPYVLIADAASALVRLHGWSSTRSRPISTTIPYETYRWLRDDAPVYHNEQYGFWALSRYDDVVAAHRDWKTFSERARRHHRPAHRLRTRRSSRHEHHLPRPARARPAAQAREPGVHAAGGRRPRAARARR